jgi:hypothetical protein
MQDFASSIMCVLLTACLREEGCRYSYGATVTGWKPGRERERERETINMWEEEERFIVLKSTEPREVGH